MAALANDVLIAMRLMEPVRGGQARLQVKLSLDICLLLIYPFSNMDCLSGDFRFFFTAHCGSGPPSDAGYKTCGKLASNILVQLNTVLLYENN